MKNRNVSVDILRLFACFLVVCIHVQNYIGKDFVMPLARTSVPLFFMISGYYFFSEKKSEVIYKLKKSGVKIISLYIFVSFVYWMYSLCFCIINDGDFHRIPFGLWMVYVWIVDCSQPLHEITGGALWYLTAMLQGIGLILCLVKLELIRKYHQYMKCFSFCLIFVGIVVQKYICFLKKEGIGMIPFNKLIFISFPFMILGFALASENKKKCITRYPLCILLLLVVAIIEYNTVPNKPIQGDVFLITLPLSYLIFSYVLTDPLGKFELLGELGKRYSLWIYCIHGLVLCTLVNSSLHVFASNPIIVFGISFVFAILMDKVNKRLKIIQ